MVLAQRRFDWYCNEMDAESDADGFWRSVVLTGIATM